MGKIQYSNEFKNSEHELLHIFDYGNMAKIILDTNEADGFLSDNTSFSNDLAGAPIWWLRSSD